MAEKELKEKVLAYRILEARINGLLKNREMLVAKLVEIENTIESIKELKKNDNILFSLGSDTYAFGKLTERKLIMEVGANVAFEKPVEQALDTLNKKKEEFENILKGMEKEISEVSSALDELATDLQEISKSQK